MGRTRAWSPRGFRGVLLPPSINASAMDLYRCADCSSVGRHCGVGGVITGPKANGEVVLPTREAVRHHDGFRREPPAKLATTRGDKTLRPRNTISFRECVVLGIRIFFFPSRFPPFIPSLPYSVQVATRSSSSNRRHRQGGMWGRRQRTPRAVLICWFVATSTHRRESSRLALLPCGRWEEGGTTTPPRKQNKQQKSDFRGAKNNNGRKRREKAARPPTPLCVVCMANDNRWPR